MIEVSEAYKKACENSSRQGYIEVKYGLYNKRAKGGITSIEAPKQPFSILENTVNEIRETINNYISGEPNRIKLDGTFMWIENKNTPNTSQKIAYWNSEISGADGRFTTPPKIAYLFSDYLNLTNLTLYFQELVNEFNIYYYKDNILIETINIINNSDLILETNKEIDTTQTFNKMEIEFVKTNEPYRYVKFNEVDFGVVQTFEANQIQDIDIREELSLTSNELSSNSLNLSMQDFNGTYDILNPNNKLNTIEEKQRIEVVYYLKVNNVYSQVSLGTFLLKNFKTTNNLIEIEAYDNTYFMDKKYYGSHFYNDELVSKIYEDLFSYFSFIDYKISDEVLSMRLTGYIPIVDFREAIRIVAESCQAVVRKTRDNEIEIFKINSDELVVKNFATKEMQNLEASASIYNNIVDVIEYKYELKEIEEVYKTTMDKGEKTIIFNKYPIKEDTLIKGVENENYTIKTIYANSCVINVLQDNTEIYLKAQYYEENTNANRIKKDETIKFIDDYSIKEIDNKFINSNNSNQIGQWKLATQNVSVEFETLSKPYIQSGDTIEIQTKYGQIRKFVPTELDFNMSIIQSIKGEI